LTDKFKRQHRIGEAWDVSEDANEDTLIDDEWKRDTWHHSLNAAEQERGKRKEKRKRERDTKREQKAMKRKAKREEGM
jgi:hypothetical protein